MEVLSSYTSPKAHEASPYTSPRAASSSNSIPHRRASTKSLDLHSKLALPVDHTVFVKFHGDSTRTGVSVPHAAQISSASPRTFAPLTPIIASPVTTPTMSTTPLYVMSDKESAKERLTAIQDLSHLERNSSIRVIHTPFPPSDEKAVWVSEISPTWTSTPPTPPPKPPRYRSVARRASSSVPPSASLPNSLNPRAFSSTDNIQMRRASLPPVVLSKPLPPTPPLPPSPSLRSRRSHRSRRSSQISESSLRDGIMEPDSGRSSKPIFHVVESGSDDEDNGSCTPLTASPKEMLLEQRMKAPGASENSWLNAKKQDDIRRYHALAELLTTEEGYLMDLRELVNAYIRQLPTLSCRPIANSSSNLSISPFVRSPTSATFMITALSSTSRSPSHSQLPLASPNSSLVFPDNLSVPTPSKDKNASRYMFTDEDLELVTRNIDQILRFHEVFVEELRTALIPLGFSMSYDGSEIGDILQKKDLKPPDPSLEAAIAVVSTIFTHKAALFDLYETFCAGHTEAFDLVRKVQQAHSMEWDAFEQRSSQLVTELRNPVSYTQTVEGSATMPAEDDLESFEARRKRRHSLSSLDVPARPPRVRSNSNVKHASIGPLDNGVTREKISRLVFMDYLIKPIQRICKYPLLLDQLKTDKSFRKSSQESLPNGDSIGVVDANAVVEVASQAMRHVASSVDEARRRQDISTKSSLIVNRISNPLAAQSSSSMRSLVAHNLSPLFLSSLGACLLAGSIDVIHHYVDKIPGSSGTVKAKYLGAFLYMGGYLILVKVSKGKVYEPRHWFSLAGFELVDVSEEDALLPCSFRLSSKGHHFDMAAACQREKGVWISAFRESLTLPPSWSNEPVCSLQAHGRSDFLLEDVSSEGTSPIPPMPTIQSIPELQGVADGPAPGGRVDTTLPRGQPRPDSVNLSLPPSRRSSTVSVKAIFSPVSESTILIRRASPPARQQVERGLRDVFSDLCLSARSHANTHEEELFQAPKVIRSGFSKSSSGLGMAGMGVAAKNRLTKRESVLVQRRTSAIEGLVSPPDEDTQTGLLKRTSTVANRRHTKKLKIVSIPLAHTSEGEGGTREALPDTPPALSQCSSITASNAGSVSCSPVGEMAPARALPISANTNVPRPDLLVVHEDDYRPKRSRSMVDNVKGIFQSRSSSPASSVSGDQSLSSSPKDSRSQLNASLNAGLLKWWSGTIRRRARSAPGTPEDLLPFTSPTYSDASPTDSSTPPIVVRRNKTTKERRPGLLSTSESGQLCAYTEPATNSLAESNFQQQNATVTPVRQPSLFSSTTPRRQMKAFIRGDSTPSPRLQRNLSFLQRLSPLTSATTLSSHAETA